MIESDRFCLTRALLSVSFLTEKNHASAFTFGVLLISIVISFVHILSWCKQKLKWFLLYKFLFFVSAMAIQFIIMFGLAHSYSPHAHSQFVNCSRSFTRSGQSMGIHLDGYFNGNHNYRSHVIYKPRTMDTRKNGQHQQKKRNLISLSHWNLKCNICFELIKNRNKYHMQLKLDRSLNL